MNNEEKTLITENLAHYMRLMAERSGCYKGENFLGKPVYPDINCEAWLTIHMFDGKSIELYNHPEESLDKHCYCGDNIMVNISFNVGEDDGTTSTENESTDILELDPAFYDDAVSIYINTKKNLSDRTIKRKAYIPLSLIAWVEFSEEL